MANTIERAVVAAQEAGLDTPKAIEGDLKERTKEVQKSFETTISNECQKNEDLMRLGAVAALEFAENTPTAKAVYNEVDAALGAINENNHDRKLFATQAPMVGSTPDKASGEKQQTTLDSKIKEGLEMSAALEKNLEKNQDKTQEKEAGKTPLSTRPKSP